MAWYYQVTIHCVNKCIMTSSNGNIFSVTGHLCEEFTGPGEFPTQRPVPRGCDAFYDLRPNKRLSKQSWGWWFETLSCPLWRLCNDIQVQWRHMALPNTHQVKTVVPINVIQGTQLNLKLKIPDWPSYNQILYYYILLILLCILI